MAKKLWEILEEEEEKNKEERVEAVQKANEQFDEYVSKKGTYDTSKHTTSMNNIIKAKKNVSKESADNFKKVNKINLGDTASSVGKNVDNLWRGLNNGIYSFRQQLERVTKDNPTNRVLTEQNNFLQEQLNKNPNDEKAKALLNNYNSFQSKLNNESEEYQNKLQEKINQNSDIITKNIDSIDNPILKKTAELAPSIGQMLPGMIPGVGPVYFAGSATGNYYTDAMNRGMSEEQAKVYSGTMGLIEGALESIGAGLTKNVGKQLLKKNIKGALINYGLDIGENFLEESIVEPISELAAQIYGGKDKADWQNIGQRMIDSGIDGALVSAITGGVSGAIGAVGSKIPKQSIYIDYNTNQKLDNKTQNILKQAENIINQNSLPVQNEQYRYTDPQLNQILNNKELPMQSYQYEKSANVKINNLRQDANKYFNNTEKARNYVNMLEKIIRDKDVEIRLDADLKTADGKIANGSYSNGVITINPNSTRTGEFIAIHELTHAIGTKDMLDMVNRYRESNAEFNSAVENLLQSYNTTELTEEALSDVSAQLFGNQEFINNLSQTNPNLFKRIYNEIKYLWHQFRGYKNQDQFIDDLKYKWEQAYKNNNSNIVKNNEILYNANERESDIYDTTRSNTKYENPRMETEDEKVNTRSEYEIRRIEEEKYYESNRKEVEQLIKDEIKIKFNFEDDVINEIYNNVDKDEITEQDIYDAFDKHREITMSEPSQQIINNIQSINKILRNTRLDISYIKGDIADWNDLRKSQLGKFRLANDGRGVDTLYKELLELFPGYFDANITNPTEQLLTLIEWRNITEEELLKPETYRLTDEDLIEIKDFILNSKEYLKSIKNIDFTRDNKLNTNTTKYSIQESENNSGSFYLQKNRFDVSGNENLANAKTLFYRTRDDGQYYVQATDGSGKITYDGVFYGEKQLARSLGEEIANKIVNTSESTNNEIYLQSDNIKSETDYMMAHRPTETGAYASNITKGTGEWDSLMPEDVYEHPEWYFDMNQEYSKESFKVLKQIKNNPNAEITIYRATTGNKINKGDWVTLSKKYAEYHNNSQFKGKGNIIELKVKAKDVQYAGDDINEFGYFPQTDIQTTDNPDIRFSQNNDLWQQYIDKNYKPTGTRTNLKDILPTAPKKVAPSVKNNTLETGEYTKQKNKLLNPTEISNLTLEDASTTPELKQKKYEKGNRESSFFSNIVTDAKFLNKDLRQEMAKDENIRYYKGITNAETLEKAYTNLQNGGKQETLKWFNKENKNIDAEDVVKGWILLKQYQDNGDYQGAVEVAKKMRDIGTKAGQTIQAYNILSRLTPEGMFYYAQSELSEAYNKMAEGKSKAWIDENRAKFDLTPEETKLIKEKMESIQGIEDERTKKIALGEIQKIISDKLPATASQSIKAWMRISMLFNPKTQVRNVAGNAVILPVNMTSDFISSGIDKVISKKTGVRTTGNTSIKSYANGFGKGLFESYDDFRKGINTRNIEGNRFEVSEGKNFKDKGIGKALNRIDNLLSFMLDAGDRGFYEATFTNSINNQLVLNNTTEVTQDMIDIATNEALQRTWQDNNAYTQTVLTIRNALNGKVGKHKGMSYGLGDILIPFAKTPANLTKAIVDYSPVGLTKTLAIDARKFKNSLENGQFTPQLQHQFVQNLGKGMAGSFLYVLGYSLANAGIASGEADDDKDVKNFMKNSLGISSYSIKIGNKTFTYDWAQPVATPLAIMTNYVKYSKDNPEANALEKIWKSMNIGTEQLLEQSFMESLNTVLNGSGTTLENLSQSILELPARAIPTFSKQIVDMVDPIQRTSFEYDKPFQSAINSVKAKIPGISKELAPSVDTLGNEIQKYGGDNNIWNVMFNPANTNKGKLSKAGEEIYNVYIQTGDTTIFPRTAPYYINNKGEKITMTSSEKSDFQKVTGKYVESILNGLINDKDYKKLNTDKKAKLINEIVSDSYSKAKYDVLKIDSEQYEKLRKTLKSVSTTSYYDYKFKTEDMKNDNEKINVLVDSNYSNKEKQILYETYIKSKTDEKYDIVKGTGLNINSYLEYKLADSNNEFASDKKDDGTVNGKTITNSAKNKRYNYINSISGATYTQKLILYALEYEPSSNTDKQQVINYVKTLKGKTDKEKLDILSNFKGITLYKDGTFKY